MGLIQAETGRCLGNVKINNLCSVPLPVGCEKSGNEKVMRYMSLQGKEKNLLCC